MLVNVKEVSTPIVDDRFENKFDHLGIFYSRYIASWVKEGGKINIQFKDWLRSIGLPEDEIEDIYFLASNGKMELETSAGNYIKDHPPMTRRQELGLDPYPTKKEVTK